MAANKPAGDKARKRAVKKRTQRKTAVLGQVSLDQARQDIGRIHGGEARRADTRSVIRRGGQSAQYASPSRPTNSLEFAACASVSVLSEGRTVCNSSQS